MKTRPALLGRSAAAGLLHLGLTEERNLGQWPVEQPRRRRMDFVFNLKTGQTPLRPSYPLSLPWQKILGEARGLHSFPGGRWL